VKLLTAILRPSRIDEVRDALRGAGVTGITLSEVRGHGRQGGHTEVYRGAEYRTDFLPKVKLEVVVEDEDVERMATLIADASRTGKVGDGKIWATPVDMLIRIRTDERGSDALH
jgi:nitrogen regulatory protein P-II 1